MFVYNPIPTYLTLATGQAKAHKQVRPFVTSRKEFTMIGPIKVGHMSIDQADRTLGPGSIQTGAHPQGARLWQVGAGNIVLRLDGFEPWTDNRERVEVATICIDPSE